MQLQECTMDDLFIHYLVRLNHDYPFIRLKTDNCSTTISLGWEACDDLKEEKSHQVFSEFQKYPISVNFQKIEDTIKKQNDFSTFTVIAENELLMEYKIPLDHKYCILEDETLEGFSKNFFKYLETHKRVILSVSKMRYCEINNGDSPAIFCDPRPIGIKDAAEASPLLTCNAFYSGFPDSNVQVGTELVTSLFEIQHLDKEIFDVFFLKESRNTVIFEIINKTL